MIDCYSAIKSNTGDQFKHCCITEGLHLIPETNVLRLDESVDSPLVLDPISSGRLNVSTGIPESEYISACDCFLKLIRIRTNVCSF